jgi:acetyltransferase-like isoleucine patch superfamily enzyme
MQIQVTDQHIEAFRRHRLFFDQSGQSRLSTGDVIQVDECGVVERYAAVLGGNSIPNIGSFSYTWSGLPPEITIGRYCSIAHSVRVIDPNHPLSFVSTSSFSYDTGFGPFGACLRDNGVGLRSRQVESRAGRNDLPVIGNDVWIGQDVLLARGITLGTGCVIGAGSVVTKSVPPYAIVGGNPAKLIRMRFDDGVIERLLASRWWRYKVSDIGPLSIDDPERFMDQLEVLRSSGRIREFDGDARSIPDLINELAGLKLAG